MRTSAAAKHSGKDYPGLEKSIFGTSGIYDEPSEIFSARFFRSERRKK